MVSEAEILGRIRQLEQWRTEIPRSIFRDFSGCCFAAANPESAQTTSKTMELQIGGASHGLSGMTNRNQVER